VKSKRSYCRNRYTLILSKRKSRPN